MLIYNQQLIPIKPAGDLWSGVGAGAAWEAEIYHVIFFLTGVLSCAILRLTF